MKRKFKVLWFTNTPSLASRKLEVNTHLGGWISSLEKEIAKYPEIQLGVAFPYGNSKIPDFYIGTTRYFPVPMQRDRGKLFGLRNRWCHKIEMPYELKLYENIIKQFDPDIIHVFGSERSFGLIGNTCEKPVILQIQGNLTVYIEKWFAGVSYFDILRYCRKKNFILGYGIFHSYYLFKKYSIREREIFKQCNYIIGRTDWDRRISRILSPGSKYYHCDELLREEFYTKKWEYTERRRKIIISTISALTYKGLEAVLKTGNLLNSLEGFEFEWHLVGVVGNEEIISITEGSTGLRFRENNIYFLGSLDADSLVRSLIDCDCYIHPSHIENSPNSVCEAMLLGTPVIATFAGGTSSLMMNGTEGILVQDGDHYVLAGAILELVNSPEMMSFYSKNARKRAISRHDPETIVSRVLEIYQNIL